jgi:fructoselysine-6-P-deglycase FrlB-like protein
MTKAILGCASGAVLAIVLTACGSSSAPGAAQSPSSSQRTHRGAVSYAGSRHHYRAHQHARSGAVGGTYRQLRLSG